MIEQLDRSLKWHWLADVTAWTIEQAIIIQQIPAPTFAEKPRAEHIAQQFHALGLEQIEMDAMCNVYGLLPGQQSGQRGVMLAAHIDTVFPDGTDLTIRREGDLIYGPGLGDNSMGVAGMLGVVSVMRRSGLTPERDVWLVATTREEGLGDLGGMRAAFARLQPRIASVINVEGLAFGHVYHAGIAVRRLKISARTPGGHSWLHFGRPSAIHAIVQLGARITAIDLPPHPRTTYNIGLIEGGQSINSIATRASLWLDMRSEERSALEAFELRVRREIAALSDPEIQVTIEVVGDRPSGNIASDHPLVEQALAALMQVGLRGTLEIGSTDGNVPLSEGCPTVTVGVTRGGNAHRLDEYIEVTPVASGLRQLVLLTLASAGTSQR